LLHGDGTDGAQNNTFLDSSTNNFTITRNGNTTQGSFSPFSLAAGEFSNFFDGAGDYLSVADNAALRLGTSEFTIEAWVYITTAAENTIVAKGSGAGATTGWLFRVDTSMQAEFLNVTTQYTNTTTPLSLNTWHHVAAIRDSSNNLYISVDGVLSASLVTLTANYTQTETMNIGTSRAPAVNLFKGYISNFRLVKGSALYTANFTPPTAPLTAVSGTELLTCQSNRFVDNSSNAFAITVNGNTSIQPFSPFAPTAAYDASVNGGSGFFDGTGDYLTAPDDNVWSFAGDFTLEAFVYRTVGAANQFILIQSDNSSAPGSAWFFSINSSNKLFSACYKNGSTFALFTSTLNVPINEWVHLAFVRTGSTVSQYVNGVRSGTNASFGGQLNNPSEVVGIGARNTGGEPVTGYLSNVRIISGSGPYDATSSTITVPTAPLTAITNTELLCNFTNAGIFDNTGKNNLETVGNAQIDTTTVKYGTGSMEFDGTGDWLLMPSSPNLAFGSGDFTVEMWIYITDGTPSFQGLFGATSTGATDSFTFSLTGERLRYSTYSADILVADVGDAISLNTWTHVALTRESGTARLFKDGALIKSVAGNTTGWTASPFVVGNGFANSYPFYGLIDDLRVTLGVCRYNATFTPPTAAFPDL
jgi:hypothetical protein